MPAAEKWWIPLPIVFSLKDHGVRPLSSACEVTRALQACLQAKEWRCMNCRNALGGLECVRMDDQRVVEWIDVWLLDCMWRRNVRVGTVGLEVERCVDCNWKTGVIIAKRMNGDEFAFDAKSGFVRRLEVKGKDKNCYFGLFFCCNSSFYSMFLALQ